MTDKNLGRLGLAKRAGRVAAGFDPALTAVKDGTARLVLLASDLSEKTLKEWRFSAERYGIPTRALPHSKADIGMALGAHREVGIVAVCDDGFAKAIERDCPQQEEE